MIMVLLIKKCVGSEGFYESWRTKMWCQWM